MVTQSMEGLGPYVLVTVPTYFDYQHYHVDGGFPFYLAKVKYNAYE